MKNNPIRKHAVGMALALLAALSLAACATQPRSEDDQVIKRAQERRDAIIAGELEKAYTYYSPGYRSTHSLIDFAVQERSRRVAQTSAEYLSHECEQTRCLVKFKMGFRVAAPVPGMSVYDSTSNVEDTWIKSNGEWWYLPKN